MRSSSPIILAIDSTDLDWIRSLIDKTHENVGVYKFGLEFYLKHGLNTLARLRKDYDPLKLFLDLKLHDIPNTVGGAARAISALSPEFLTVHASGGPAMVSAAVKELPETAITAVTILTSLDQAALTTLHLTEDLMTTTIALAKSATEAGAKAIVTSPLEVGALRDVLPKEIALITPGIRLADSPNDDQRRTLTPRDAIAAGADFLVIGRPISGSEDPGRTARHILDSL